LGILGRFFGKEEASAATEPEPEQKLPMAEETAPAEQPAAQAQVVRDYAIFTGPKAVVAGIKTRFFENVPVASPDGRQLFIGSRGELLALGEKQEEDGSKKPELTRVTNEEGKPVCISADGQFITDDQPPATIEGIKPFFQRSSGIVLNATALKGYIEELERKDEEGNVFGYDMSHEKEILAELERATAEAGLSEDMAKVRLSGVMVGEPEAGTAQSIIKSAFPVDLSDIPLEMIVPAVDKPGYANITKFTM